MLPAFPAPVVAPAGIEPAVLLTARARLPCGAMVPMGCSHPPGRERKDNEWMSGLNRRWAESAPPISFKHIWQSQFNGFQIFSHL